MPLASVIFESGITLKLIGSDWHIANLSGGRTEKIDPNGASRFKVRPVVMTEINGTRKIDYLLRKINDPFDDPLVSSINYFINKSIDITGFSAMNIGYLLNKMMYHCTKLALSYSSICEVFSTLPHLEQFKDVVNFHDAEPYFEFDSLLTAIRSTYDSFRYILWQHFGNRGSMPRNFCKTLNECEDKIPEELSNRLEISWSNYGEKITDYRDCFTHYVPIGLGLDLLFMRKLDNGVWSLNAYIPDNPRCHSQAEFVFDQRFDALTYGFDAANETIEIAKRIADSLGVVV